MKPLTHIFLVSSFMVLAGCIRSEPEDVRVTYACESGAEIHASYPSQNEALVEYGGEILRMTSAVSASGARYVGEDLEWWTKGIGAGSEGMLLLYEKGETGDPVEVCLAVEY